MPVTATSSSTKPSNVKWFPYSSDANRALIKSLNDWTKTQPGFISQTAENLSADASNTTYIWDTVENYAAWHTARADRPEQIARAAYNSANNIVSTLNETIS
jgi:hypothetical protein